MHLELVFGKRHAAVIGNPESAKARFMVGKQKLLNARKLIDIYKLRFVSSFRSAKNNPLKIEPASISSARHFLKEIEPVHGLISELDAAIRANYVSANQIGLVHHRNQLRSELGDVFAALLHYYLSVMNSAVRMMKALYHSKHMADKARIEQLKNLVKRTDKITADFYGNHAFRYAYDNIPNVKKRYDELVEWESRVFDGIKRDFQ